MPAAGVRAVAFRIRQGPAFYDAMYEHQERLIAEGDRYPETVRSLGLDVARARRDAASEGGDGADRLGRRRRAAIRLLGTPGFLVNGVAGGPTRPRPSRIIDRQLAAIRRR